MLCWELTRLKKEYKAGRSSHIQNFWQKRQVKINIDQTT